MAQLTLDLRDEEIPMAKLEDVEKKSAIMILTELAASFTDKDTYMRYLEGVAIIAFKDALCTVDEHNLGMSEENKALHAFGRSAAFLLFQENEIQRRLNQVVCGREITYESV